MAQSSTVSRASAMHTIASAQTSQLTEQPQYPSALKPDLIDVFLVHRNDRNVLTEEEAREEAEALAAKIIVSGSGLYMSDKETLTGALGPGGAVVYRIAQDGTIWIRKIMIFRLPSSSSCTISALPKSSSTADSGQNASRSRTRMQQRPLPSCPGEKTSDQLRHGMKKRRLFYQDIDRVNNSCPLCPKPT